jgi:hypothetical protein
MRRFAFRVALLAATVLGCVAGPAAAASFTWSGADTTSPNWSQGANWAGGAAPAAGSSVATLSFPILSSSDCRSVTPAGSCYSNNNDVAGLKVGQLDVAGYQGNGNNEVGYSLQGNGITLQNGVETASASVLTLPIALGASQSWGVGGNLQLTSPLSGNHALTINMAYNENLTMGYGVRMGRPVAVHDEVGPLTIHDGNLTVLGEVNSSDGNPVALSYVGAQLLGGTTLGALTTHQSEVTFGQQQPGATFGNVTAKSAAFASSALTFHPGSPGSAGLSSTGAIHLGGSDLVLQETPGQAEPCDAGVPVGTTSTLISTSGTLSGAFRNVADGGTVSDGCADFRIHIHEAGATQTVTATFLGRPAPTSLTVSPQAAATNQAVTLTATVSPGYPGGAFNGSVTFTQGGTPIAGCASVPITFDPSSQTGVALCSTSFAAAASPVALAAVFTPDDATAAGGFRQTTATGSLGVARGGTGVSVGASTATSATGQSVTYTATVTPAQAGPVEPTGSVAFSDAGTPIGSCGSQPVTTAAGSSTATCTVTYTSAGYHSMTANYSGDANFVSAQDSAAVVTVTALAPAAPPVTAATPAPPAISIAVPRQGATYVQGAKVKASYSCTAPAGASVSSCAGPVASGAAISTAKPGTHSFTVTAGDGAAASRTVTYTVAGRPAVSGMSLRASVPALRLTVSAGEDAASVKTIVLSSSRRVRFSAKGGLSVHGANGRAVRFTARMAHGRLMITLVPAVQRARLTIGKPGIAVHGAKPKTIAVSITDADRTTTKVKPEVSGR